MNFMDYTYEELDGHIMAKLIFEEDEMSHLLRGHIFIEKCLDALLAENFSNPNIFFKKARSFELKLDLTFSMGLIDKNYYSAFKALNNIRNDYAHKHNYILSFESLNSLKLNWVEIQHKAFRGASTKGVVEAAKLAVSFLCWSAIKLIKKPKEQSV